MPKQVIITPHARDKINALAAHGVRVDDNYIRGAFAAGAPARTGWGGRLVIEKPYDETRVIRLVYVETAAAITLVTLYPARKGRYGKGEI